MNKFRNQSIIIATALIVLIGVFTVGYFFYQSKQSEIEKIANETEKQSPVAQQLEKDIEVIAENLEVPWEIAFLPDKSILLAERPGRIRFIDNKGVLQSSPVLTLKDVKEIGEGGLLGIAIHPNFPSNHWIYLYYTYQINGETYNKIVRFEYSVVQLAVACPENKPDCNTGRTIRLAKDKTIVDNIPAASNHNGGRIAFGPDGHLYITTGDAENSSSAQDTESLNGKILRIKDNGSIPSDNPFGNAVYSYGHRNSQGLAWDDKGRLWATEHGPQAMDELNLIEKGANYGWPVIQGGQMQEGMVSPIIQSGSTVTWAPAGAAFLDGSIFFGGLRGEALFEYKPADKSLKKYFQEEFGRIRAVVLGPDGYLYITTSNTDGRGSPKEGDDKLIKVNPNIFK